MKQKKHLISFLLVLFGFFTLLVPTAWSIGVREISLEEVLSLAERNSPRLSASQYKKLASDIGVDIAYAKYFPTIKLDSIYDNGLPGSSAPMLDVHGVMASPYRKGASVGLTAKQLVYDFGRTAHAVKASEFKAEAATQDIRITAYEVKRLALRKFYECSLFRSQRDIWKYLGDESKVITKEALHFVDTGQRSVVDRDLSKIQTEEAYSFEAYFSEKLNQSITELAIIMQVDDTNFTCPALSKELSHSFATCNNFENSPFFAKAILEAEAAKEKMNQERAELLPEISLVGSTGYVDKTRLVTKKSYSVGIGISMPIVDFGISSKIKQSAALAAEKQTQIAAEVQNLQELNAQYDEIIKSTEVFIKKLNGQLKIVDHGFFTAKKRYFDLEGELVDLREAFRNLSRVKASVENAKAQLLQAKGEKALLNGAE